MQEGDPLAKNFDLDGIAIDVARELARRESILALSDALSREGNCSPLSPDLLSSSVGVGIHIMGFHVGHETVATSISNSYEEFTSQAGPDFESRIVTLSTVDRRLQQKPDRIYLLAATARDQKEINAKNVGYGAIQKENGLVVFFKFLPIGEVADDEGSVSVKIMKASGQLDDKDNKETFVAVELNPVEEQALIDEFEKATRTLVAQAEERRAKLLRMTRPSSRHLSFNRQGSEDESISPLGSNFTGLVGISFEDRHSLGITLGSIGNDASSRRIPGSRFLIPEVLSQPVAPDMDAPGTGEVEASDDSGNDSQ